MSEGGRHADVRDPWEDALLRWLIGEDGALEEWLDGRVRKVRHRPRTLAVP